jgi:AraC family transcriptional regulator
MRARLQRAGQAFAELVRDIRLRDAWDTAYVDAIRQPPETNTFGAALAHLLDWDAIRREIVAGALLAHGIDTACLDPEAWEHGERESRGHALVA